MNPISLLFVEDDIADQMNFKRFIRHSNLDYQYDLAKSVSEAIVLLKKNNYDLVLTDHELGDGTGFELFEYIPKTSLVIFVTGTGNEEIAVKALKKGAVDYLAKDIDGEHLKLLPIVIDNALKAQAVKTELEVYRNHLEYMVEQRTFELEQEIKKRKEVEEQLRLLATTFETHEAIVITDAKAQILRVNKAFTQITGYSAEEVVGKKMNLLKSGRQADGFYNDLWHQLLKTGRYEGELWNRRKNGEVYPECLTITAVKNDEGFTSHYVGILSDITTQKNAEREIQQLAFYDPLTSLANRRLLLDRLKQELISAKRNNTFGYVIYLDLDEFKMLNDNFGHHIGDELLIQVAQRLRTALRKEDTPSRLGGDEFVVLIHAEETDLEQATNNALLIAQKIRQQINRPYLISDIEHHFTSSIGVAMYPTIAFSPEEVLQQADKAMYQSKHQGKNTINII